MNPSLWTPRPDNPVETKETRYIPQDVLDLLDLICGIEPTPAMFSPDWWQGGYGEAFLAARQKSQRRIKWASNKWPEPQRRYPDP